MIKFVSYGPIFQVNVQSPVSHLEVKEFKVGSNEGFFNGALLLCGKNLSEFFANYHDDMNGKVFEDWFENAFLLKLLKE